MSDLDAPTAIRNTLSLYCHLVDDRRHDELVEWFAPDAELVFDGRTFAGREELLARWRASPVRSGKHFTTNTVLEISGSVARAASDFLFVWTDHTLGGMGRYDDELVLFQGRWLFRRREITLLEEHAARVQ